MSMIKSLYEPFMKWQKHGNIKIFSDPHFEDPSCELMSPLWITPEEHAERINNELRSGDTIVCLGDVGDPSYIEQINKKHIYKVLITGNHDRVSMYKDYFDEIYTGAIIIAPQIILSHEPIYTDWAVSIHGHLHNGEYVERREDGTIKGINLAADVVDWKVFNLNEFVNIGGLHGIPNIHRITIDNATKNKNERS